MSVQSFEEVFKDSGRVGREDAERTRYFLSKTTRVDDDIDTLLLARPDLAPYQPHPRLKGLFVDEFRPERIEGTLHWNVVVRYAPVELERRRRNPLSEPADISWGTSNFTQFTLTDHRGQPRLNSAGELLDPAEREDARWVISVSKNVARIPRFILGYNLAVNADAPTIQGITFPPRTLLLKGLRISNRKFDIPTRTAYFVFSFQLHVNPRRWLDRPLNRGRHELSEEGLQEIFDPGPGRSGERLVEPVFLDRKGKAFRDGRDKLKNPGPNEIITLQYLLYRPRPFAVLPVQ